VSEALWNQCLKRLSDELGAQPFGTWIQPLQVSEEAGQLQLFAPNRFVLDWVREHYLEQITRTLAHLSTTPPAVSLAIGNKPTARNAAAKTVRAPGTRERPAFWRGSLLNPNYVFPGFVAGNSNQIAHAAALQTALNPGQSYNPLFIYGGVGLGKTHLMQAVGHELLKQRPDAQIVYIQSERYVSDMVKALQHNAIEDFKRFYRSVDTLLIDDIQFFAGKERSQEEFFHTFNALMERKQQIILTCDRYPREVDGLDERLKSRFGSGLTVTIAPPELETRAAILIKKAHQHQPPVALPEDVALFVAKRLCANVRELEGALTQLLAHATFMAQPLSVELAKHALKDRLAVQDRLITIDNIQRIVCEYFKLRMHDLVSGKRSRSIARPRQLAMSLAKELTSHSLPEIGDAFGGRDHTTVLHACRKVAELRQSDDRLHEDYTNLRRILTH
jgi:chromosomal replication initiator protein